MIVIVNCLMALVGAISFACLWFPIRSILRMTPETYGPIRWGFILKATGLFITSASVVDYFWGMPMGWPWLLLAGVVATNSGTVLLYLMDRREPK